MVVFAGYPYLRDVWVLSLAGTPAWAQLIPTGAPPTARTGHSAIYDPVGDRMVVAQNWHRLTVGLAFPAD